MSKENGFCDVCGTEIEIKMCCSGHECGCMGMPIEPPVCSEKCYDIYMSKEYQDAKKIPSNDLAKICLQETPVDKAIQLLLPFNHAGYFLKQNLSEKDIEDIINDLNEYASDVDNYEYGLPIYGEHMDKMKEIVKKLITGPK